MSESFGHNPESPSSSPNVKGKDILSRTRGAVSALASAVVFSWAVSSNAMADTEEFPHSSTYDSWVTQKVSSNLSYSPAQPNNLTPDWPAPVLVASSLPTSSSGITSAVWLDVMSVDDLVNALLNASASNLSSVIKENRQAFFSLINTELDLTDALLEISDIYIAVWKILWEPDALNTALEVSNSYWKKPNYNQSWKTYQDLLINAHFDMIWLTWWHFSLKNPDIYVTWQEKVEDEKTVNISDILKDFDLSENLSNENKYNLLKSVFDKIFYGEHSSEAEWWDTIDTKKRYLEALETYYGDNNQDLSLLYKSTYKTFSTLEKKSPQISAKELKKALSAVFSYYVSIERYKQQNDYSLWKPHYQSPALKLSLLLADLTTLANSLGYSANDNSLWQFSSEELDKIAFSFGVTWEYSSLSDVIIETWINLDKSNYSYEYLISYLNSKWFNSEANAILEVISSPSVMQSFIRTLDEEELNSQRTRISQELWLPYDDISSIYLDQNWISSLHSLYKEKNPDSSDEEFYNKLYKSATTLLSFPWIEVWDRWISWVATLAWAVFLSKKAGIDVPSELISDLDNQIFKFLQSIVSEEELNKYSDILGTEEFNFLIYGILISSEPETITEEMILDAFALAKEGIELKKLFKEKWAEAILSNPEGTATLLQNYTKTNQKWPFPYLNECVIWADSKSNISPELTQIFEKALIKIPELNKSLLSSVYKVSWWDKSASFANVLADFNQILFINSYSKPWYVNTPPIDEDNFCWINEYNQGTSKEKFYKRVVQLLFWVFGDEVIENRDINLFSRESLIWRDVKLQNNPYFLYPRDFSNRSGHSHPENSLIVWTDRVLNTKALRFASRHLSDNSSLWAVLNSYNLVLDWHIWTNLLESASQFESNENARLFWAIYTFNMALFKSFMEAKWKDLSQSTLESYLERGEKLWGAILLTLPWEFKEFVDELFKKDISEVLQDPIVKEAFRKFITNWEYWDIRAESLTSDGAEDTSVPLNYSDSMEENESFYNVYVLFFNRKMLFETWRYADSYNPNRARIALKAWKFLIHLLLNWTTAQRNIIPSLLYYDIDFSNWDISQTQIAIRNIFTKKSYKISPVLEWRTNPVLSEETPLTLDSSFRYSVPYDEKDWTKFSNTVIKNVQNSIKYFSENNPDALFDLVKEALDSDYFKHYYNIDRTQIESYISANSKKDFLDNLFGKTDILQDSNFLSKMHYEAFSILKGKDFTLWEYDKAVISALEKHPNLESIIDFKAWNDTIAYLLLALSK